MSDPLVRSRHLEAHLARVGADISDPRAGLFGPGSMHWRVIGESAIMLGGPRALLMQLAHPAVAHGVSRFSTIHQDPAGRFRKTMHYMYSIIFGDQATAFETARTVHRLHSRVRGTYPETLGSFAAGDAYAANTVPPLLWVAATLTDSAICAYEGLIAPLTQGEKDQMIRECADLYAMFGIPPDQVPPDWAAFEGYVSRQCGQLGQSVGSEAHELATLALRAPRLVARPVFEATRALTARWLPAPLREPFGFAPTAPALGEAVEITLRRVFNSRALPSRVRHAPTWFRAQRRMRGDPRPDRLSDWTSALATRLVSRRPIKAS